MKATELFSYVNNKAIEYHWHDNDVIMMPLVFEVEEFNKLLPASIFDDDGIECVMKDNYFCFHMRAICEYCGIELEEIFPKN